MRDIKLSCLNSGLKRVGSKDSELTSCQHQPRPGDLGLGDLGDDTELVSTVCFISPKWTFFSKSPREWGIVPVNIYF